jgi:hypothetical protein
MALRHPDPQNTTPGPPHPGTLDILYRRADLWATYRDAAQAHLALWDRQGYGLSRRTDVGLALALALGGVRDKGVQGADEVILGRGRLAGQG